MDRFALVVVLVLIGLTASTGAQTPPTTAPATEPSTGPAATQPAPQRVTTPSGLTIVYIQPGTGTQQAAAGDIVSVHYTGKLADGTVFDSSYRRGEPIEFPLGSGRVIRGWDEGIAGMKVGEKRQLIIPPNLAYGSRQRGPIPANSTLTFDVELMGIRSAGQ
jgi:peptidylprolyl isomerase